MLLTSIVLLLAGIVSEAMYITTSRVAYADTVASNSYMVFGILFIILGFIFALTSVKMPKVRIA